MTRGVPHACTAVDAPAHESETPPDQGPRAVRDAIVVGDSANHRSTLADVRTFAVFDAGFVRRTRSRSIALRVAGSAEHEPRERTRRVDGRCTFRVLSSLFHV